VVALVVNAKVPELAAPEELSSVNTIVPLDRYVQDDDVTVESKEFPVIDMVSFGDEPEKTP